MEYFENISPTKKYSLQPINLIQVCKKVFESNGFIRSGFVENLDEGAQRLFILSQIFCFGERSYFCYNVWYISPYKCKGEKDALIC